YRAEARIYATYILQHHPAAKIGVLYQNDDFGKDYVLGLKDVLRDKYGKMVVSEISYEVSVPTVDSQVVAIKTANPDIFVNIGTPKFAAQAIKKVAELGWHPIHIMTNVSASVGAVLKPAGLDNSKGILSAHYQMDVTDPQWDSYPGMQKFRAFMAKYYPEADKSESGPLTAFNTSTALVEVLKRCGDNLTRANVMKIIANMDFEINTYIPGIHIKTTPTDFYPLEQVQMARFTGEQCDPGKRRPQAMARPDHDHLGNPRWRHRHGDGFDELWHRALPARRRRGRVLSRHHPLLHLLVPEPSPRPYRVGLSRRPAGR